MNQTCECIISEIQLNLNPDYLKCTTKCDVRLTYIRFTVHDVLEIQRLVVTVPSPIHFLRKSCSIIMWCYMWKTALFTFVRHTSRYICFFFPHPFVLFCWELFVLRCGSQARVGLLDCDVTAVLAWVSDKGTVMDRYRMRH